MIIIRDKTEVQSRFTEESGNPIPVKDFMEQVGAKTKVFRCRYILGNGDIQIELRNGYCGFINGRLKVNAASGNTDMSFNQRQIAQVEKDPAHSLYFVWLGAGRKNGCLQIMLLDD